MRWTRSNLVPRPAVWDVEADQHAMTRVRRAHWKLSIALGASLAAGWQLRAREIGHVLTFLLARGRPASSGTGTPAPALCPSHCPVIAGCSSGIPARTAFALCANRPTCGAEICYGDALLLKSGGREHVPQSARGKRGNAMHAVIRFYSGPGAKELFDLLAEKKDDVESTIRGVNGFVSYTLFWSPNGGVSMTVCQDKAGTDESVQRAREWIRRTRPTSTSVPPLYPRVTSSSS